MSPFSKKLNHVEFGDKISTICDYLFSDCSGLTSIKIPSSVILIEGSAFENCENLSTATIEQADTEITLGGGCFASVKKLIANRNINVQKKIEVSPFSKNLNIAELGGKVTCIGQNLFNGCIELQTINIPEGVTTIEDCAFKDCIYLKSISLPNSLKTIGDMEDRYSGGVFYYCRSLQTITIPKNVSLIGCNAFYDCSSLKSIILPDNLNTIGGYAFYGCSSLESISLPNSLKSIDSGVFSGCTALKSIVIPQNVKEIKGSAFSDCCSLESISLPNNLKTIGSGVFYGCTTLKSMVIPPNVKEIEKYAFYGSNLENIKIKFGMTKVPDYAFYNCINLKDIDIPHSVASIGDYAFRRCYSLTSIRIPSSVTSVCDSTFEESVSAIHIETSKCLQAMPQLKSQIIEMTFSDDYEETDVTHFDEWTRMERLISLSETPPMIGDSFSKFQKKNLRVIVPTKALEVYKNTPVWKEFFFLKGGAETTDIENIKQDTVEANTTRNLSTYNLNGMKVYNTKPGHIYIRGGKKFVAK